MMRHAIDINEVNAQVAQRLGQSGHSAGLLAVCLGDAHVLRGDEDQPEISEEFPTANWPYEQLRKVADEINALQIKPDVMVLYGDMTNTGHPEAWARVFELLDPLSIPIVLALGNHEHSDPGPHDCTYKQTVTALAQHHINATELKDSWCTKTEMGDYQFVVLDSLSNGPLPSNQLAFLTRALQNEKPTVLVCHRPLIKTGNWMDPFRLIDESLDGILSEADHVPIILSGHTHKHARVAKNKTVHMVGLPLAMGLTM